MNAREFFGLVSSMRATQKLYFKTRDKNVLNQSRQLEKQVDDEIDRVITILQRNGQKNKEN